MAQQSGAADVRSLSFGQRLVKRTFDLLSATVGLLLFSWLIVLGFVAATVDTRAWGFFTQWRIGRFGRPFRIVKLRTMRNDPAFDTHVTTGRDPRITRLGSFLRRSKIDELPQLFNVVRGEMSIVGPRPEVPGFADRLEGDDRIVLSIRPGITGPASLQFRDEEKLLTGVDDPERYNAEVLFPTKVEINKEYVRNYGFVRDLSYIVQTVFPAIGSRPGDCPKESP